MNLRHRAVSLTVAATVAAAGLTSAPAVAGDGHPVYAVAHGVNDLPSLDRAVAAGANGVEIDICATAPRDAGPPWYVSHDCDGPHGRLTVPQMFAALVRVTSTVHLVWLDIKTPDKCHRGADECSTRGLADHAKLLTGAGMQVLYDLTSKDYEKNKPTFGGPGFANLAPRLTARDAYGVPLEGVGFWGDTRTAVREFEKAGVPPGQRVQEIGDCGGEDVRHDAATGAKARDKHRTLAAVLAWTMYTKGDKHCRDVLGTVDGMIAGHHDFGAKPGDAATLRSIYQYGSNRPATAGHRLFRR